LLLLLALSLAAPLASQLRDALWSNYRNYTSPFLSELPMASSPARPALSARVVCVLVRGLRVDESRTLTSLEAIRPRGLDATLALSPPTYRVPSWVGLLSAAPPEIHGVTRNDAFVPAINTLITQLRNANKNSAVVGDVFWNDWLVADLARYDEPVEPTPDLRDDFAVRTALQVLHDPQQPVQFLLVELSALEGLTDTAAAAAATTATTAAPITATETLTKSPRLIAQALRLTDARLQNLIAGLDLTNTTLLVLADRGRDSAGNDGGDDAAVSRVPLVAVGAGIWPGVQDIVQQSHIAPTIAALLGVPMPVYAQSPPLLQALDFSLAVAPPTTHTANVSTTAMSPRATLMLDSAQQLVTFHESWSEATGQTRYAAETLQRYRAAIERDDVQAMTLFVAELRAHQEAAQARALWRERLRRLPVALALVMMWVAVIGLCLQKNPAQASAGVALYFVLWLLVFVVLRGQRLSLSMFANGVPTAFFQSVAQDSSALLVATCVGVALLTRQHANAIDAALTALSAMGLIACVPLALAIAFYWQWGTAFVWVLPSSGWLAAVLIGLAHLAGLNLALSSNLAQVPLAPLVAVGAGLIHLLVRGKPKYRVPSYERVKF
jgi:hypothetical protein